MLCELIAHQTKTFPECSGRSKSRLDQTSIESFTSLRSHKALFSVNIEFISLQGQTQLMKSSRYNSGTKSVFYIDGNWKLRSEVLM